MPKSKPARLETLALYYTQASQLEQVAQLHALIDSHQLPLRLEAAQINGKLNQKRRQQLSDATAPSLLLDDNHKLSLMSAGLSVAPEWDKLQRRVVSAGRKSELLLQAAKISAESMVIDATAGFGHDSLILASSGAQVIMLEQQPIMALLLLAEQQRMGMQPNWQKLMARLHIINIDALNYLIAYQDKARHPQNTAVDVVYLDPMFPVDSYQDGKTGKGAKVGKQMQALHQLAPPPTVLEAQQLLRQAQAFLSQNQQHPQISSNPQKSARVIVKRPKLAPFFAEQPPTDSWHNDALRFDGYFL